MQEEIGVVLIQMGVKGKDKLQFYSTSVKGSRWSFEPLVVLQSLISCTKTHRLMSMNMSDAIHRPINGVTVSLFHQQVEVSH